jgi:hypothetical protein
MGIDHLEIHDEPKPFNEKDFTKYIVQGLKDAIADKRDFHLLVDKWYKDWRDIKERKIFPWKGCANWSVPVTSTATDAVIPRVMEGIFDIDPPIEAQPMNSTANQYKDVIQQFIKWDIQAHPEMMKDIWFAVQNTCWSGTGYLKCFFNKEREYDEKEIRVYINQTNGEVARDPNTGIPIEITSNNTAMLAQSGVPHEIDTVTEKSPRWKHYNPDQTVVDLKDVIFPSDAESLQDAWENSWVAIRVRHTKDFLRRKLKGDEKELYKNLDKVKIKDLDRKLEVAEDTKQREQITRYITKTKKIEDYEVYINYDVDGDGLEEKVVAIVNMQEELLFGWEKYPYEHGRCPIIPCYIKPVFGQPMGVGIPEMLYDVKGEIDAEHNQRNDRRSLSINPILMHTEKSAFDVNKHKHGIGRQWRLRDVTPSAIRYLEPPKYEGDSIEEENFNLAYAQKRSGVTDYSLGSESQISSNDTATGIMAIIREGNIGFRHFIKWFSLSMGEFFNQRFALYQQYWGEQADAEVQQWIRRILDIPGNPLSEQGLEAIKQKFNIVIRAFKEDKQLELTKAQVAHDIVSNNPLVQQFPDKLRDVTVELLRRAGIENPENFIPTIQEIQQQQLAVQQQAQVEAQRQVEAENQEANVAEAAQAGEMKETAKQTALAELNAELEGVQIGQ